MSVDASRKTEAVSFVDQIRRLREEVAGESLTLRETVDILESNSHTLVTLIFCLPFLQPIPMMGLSTVLGFLMALIALAQATRRPVWIPKRWQGKALPKDVTAKILEVGEGLALRLSKWTAPGLRFLADSPVFLLWNTFLVVTSAVLLALPLPIPFSNTVPAIVIFIHSMGRLERNGALILLSYVIFGLCLGFFVMLGLGLEAGIGLLNRPAS